MTSKLERLTVAPKEAASMIGCDVSFVYEWCRTGELASFRVGERAIRIPVEAVRAFVRQRSGMGVR